MIFSQPELAHKLLDKITQSTIAYLKDQVKAGGRHWYRYSTRGAEYWDIIPMKNFL